MGKWLHGGMIKFFENRVVWVKDAEAAKLKAQQEKARQAKMSRVLCWMQHGYLQRARNTWVTKVNEQIDRSLNTFP